SLMVLSPFYQPIPLATMHAPTEPVPPTFKQKTRCVPTECRQKTYVASVRRHGLHNLRYAPSVSWPSTVSIAVFADVREKAGRAAPGRWSVHWCQRERGRAVEQLQDHERHGCRD